MNTRVSVSLLLAAAVCFAGGGSPLFVAIRNNDLTAVRSLAHDNARDERETTALLYASAFGSLDAMKILLDAGADPNAANAFGATPLMWCVTEPAKVRLLLGHGADVKARSKTGSTPLMLAALHNGSEEVVEMLLAKGAPVKEADKNGLTFLLAAATAGNPREVKRALDAGEDVNQKDGSGATALMDAASIGDVESVRLLLAKGADPNVVTVADLVGKVKNGPISLGRFTALILASTYGPPEIVDLLLRAGAKVDAKDVRGMTALHYAVSTEAQHPEIVRLLLKAGADPAAKTATGESAVEWAAKFAVPGTMTLFSARASDRPAAERPVAAPADLPARAGAIRSLQLLEKVSAQFLNTGGCVSCHAQNLTALAASYSKAHGLPVDEGMQRGQLAGAKAFIASSGDGLMLRADPPGGIDQLDYMLLHFSAAGQKSDAAIDPIIHNMIAEQLKNGGWHRGGFARAPMEDSDVVATALAIRSIRHFAWEGRKADLDAHVESAREWLSKASPVYNEEYAMQVLGLKWAGETNEQLAPLARRLIGQQREDGGWPQNPYLRSDAYATGQTLLALAESGMAPANPIYRRGVQFLLRTQHADGSWLVKSRSPKFQPYFQSGFPYDHDQWISMAGTAWATCALAIAAEPEQVASGR